MAFCLRRARLLPYRVETVNARFHPTRFRSIGWLLLAGVLLWMVTAWPLPRVMSEAIPYSNWQSESLQVRPITSGDQLQLLYHFWLGTDALSGHSPLFHNVYEFNLGDDSVRLQPDLYYMPFSLVYAAVKPFAGHAAGWNAAGLASVLLGIVFLGLLARRYTDSWPAAGLATLVAACFPYRWITLFTGSPTGFAMAFPPMLAYGLDRAVRDRSISGGVLAGLALFCSYATDLHVFYFSALASPLLVLLSLWRSDDGFNLRPQRLGRLILPLLPFVLLAIGALAVSSIMSKHLAGSVMAGGRTLTEIGAFSPPARGLLSTAREGMANHAYFGLPLLLLLVALAAVQIAAGLSRNSGARVNRRETVTVVVLFAAVAGVILLALGARGPFHGLPIRIARQFIPQYEMIRQTVKIYGVLPVLLAPLLALLFTPLFRPGSKDSLCRTGMVLALLLTGWTVWQALAQTRPGFCRLPKENAAYAAVAADDTANAGRPPHALALPLWPGDSHWTSLCEYAIMLSRIRLVNGYAPAVPTDYFENIFKRYESLNQGVATDEQLDGLLDLGVRHLLLHANAFPEQVSPFPAAATLRALTGHPRLALIADDGQTFAFRILPRHPIEHTPHANWTDALYAASRRWDWLKSLPIRRGETAPLLLRAPVFPAPGLRFLLRTSLESTQPLLIPPGRDGVSSLTQPVIGRPDWLQADLPTPTGALISAVSGPVMMQQALLTAGELPSPGVDGSIRIQPALLFHTGHAEPGRSAVSLDPETVPAGIPLYGPNLPFPPGVYDIQLTYETPASVSPGVFRAVALPRGEELAEAPLDPAATSLILSTVTLDAEPIRFEFAYHGTVPVTLKNIRLTPSRIRLTPANAAP